MHKSVKYMAVGLVVLGICLAWVALMFSNGKSQPSFKKSAPLEVASQTMQLAVVARHDINRGHFLTAEDLEVREVPQVGLRGFTEIAHVVGRGVSAPIANGHMVLSSHLLSGISGTLQSGERAISIKVEESTAVGHKLQPGDWVDVMVVWRKDAQEVMNTQANRLLVRKRLLAYGSLMESAAPSAAPAKEKIGGNAKGDLPQDPLLQAQQARTAVLVVDADEVNALLLAERHGQVMLALRNPLEPVEETDVLAVPRARGDMPAAGSYHASGAVTLAQLVENHALPKNAAGAVVIPSPQVVRASTPKSTELPRQSRAVQMIRGNHSETVHY